MKAKLNKFAVAFLVVISNIGSEGLSASAEGAARETTLPVFQGIYRLEENVIPQVRIHRQIVPSFTETGRRKLQELRSSGYECWPVPDSRYLCRLTRVTDSFPDELAKRALARARVLGEIEFGPIRGQPERTRETSSANEWIYPQTIAFNGQTCSFFRFFRGAQAEKLFETTGCADFEFVYLAPGGSERGGKIGVSVTISRREGPEEVDYVGLVVRSSEEDKRNPMGTQ